MTGRLFIYIYVYKKNLIKICFSHEHITIEINAVNEWGVCVAVPSGNRPGPRLERGGAAR